MTFETGLVEVVSDRKDLGTFVVRKDVKGGGVVFEESQFGATLNNGYPILRNRGAAVLSRRGVENVPGSEQLLEFFEFGLACGGHGDKSRPAGPTADSGAQGLT